MARHKTVVFLGDGMADEPMPELGGRTPLMAADTPNMDRIAAEGRSGLMLTLPDGFPTSSDVANMSVLGGDLATELCGRGPLEAAAQGLECGPDDVYFRMNLVTVGADGRLRDFSAGHIRAAGQRAAIAALNAAVADPWRGGPGEFIRFYPGVSYRNLLRLHGARFSGRDVAYDKPDDNSGNPVAEHLPRARNANGEYTAAVLRDLIAAGARALAGCEPANGIWPWSGGKAANVHSVAERYRVRGAMVAAVDVINGLGRTMGLDVIRVPGATGYVDTDFEGKADAAIRAIVEDGYDFVYVHIEATDEVSHEQRLDAKIKAIEDFDGRLIGRVMNALGRDVAYCVLPDHPVPIRLGRHTRTPVPVAVYQPSVAPDAVTTYDEVAAAGGALGNLKGGALMDLLLGE